MNKTTIDWCVNLDGTPGYTLNIITGCLNGCNYCYARKLANGRLKERYCSGTILARTERSNYSPDRENQYADPFFPRFWPEKLEQIYHPKLPKAKPRGIFICDMSDLFGIGVPEDWTRQVMDAIRNDPIDRFYLLTKQPQNLARWNFPPNCWVGVTATNALELNGAVWHLADLKAEVRYVSLEPLLSWNPLFPISFPRHINWVIIGAVTKHPELPQPKVEWISEIVEAAYRAGVKVWLKNNLLPLFEGHERYEWAFRFGELRQEMPECKPV